MPNAVVYELELELLDVTPRVWRRIALPKTATFFDLHVAIQAAMGWKDSHLHQFMVAGAGGGSIAFGLPEPGGFVEPGQRLVWDYRIDANLEGPGATCRYWYDFGDDWMHLVTVKSERPREKGERLPRCLDGENACPPEDCGGPWAYEEFKQALADTKHDRHEELQEWWSSLARRYGYVAGSAKAPITFDPTKFDPKRVKFPNAKTRLAEF